MTSVNNKTQSNPAYDFSGSIPHHYEKYLGPLFFEPYALEVCKRFDPSSLQLVLELASGTGRVTRHLRKNMPAWAKLIASDISEDMLSVAKEQLKDLKIDWQIIDAQQLPFSNNSIDLIVCCFGYMFVPDKTKAFDEAYRVLKAGGTLLFTTWDELESNTLSHTYRKAAKKYLEDPLPPAYNLPFSMNDENEIRVLLEKTGFSKIQIEKINKNSVGRNAKEVVSGLAQGGLIYNEIMKRNPAWMEDIKATAEKELVEKFGTGSIKAPMSALICQALK